MHRARCAALTAALVVAGAAVLGQGQQAGSSVASIESLIRSHQYDQALQATKSGLHNTPSDFRLWTLQGIILSIEGSSTEALTAFDKSLRLSPNYGPALKGEVQLLYQSNDKRAIPLIERILKADPRDQTAREMLAMLQRMRGDCKAAIDQFLLTREAIATHPESLEAYGYCLVQTKHFQEAIPVFERLVALVPDRTYPKYDLAVILVTTKQNDAAIKILDPLLADDQRDADILSLASEAYEAVGNTPKAVALLRQAIVLSPTTPGYYVSFAAICMDHDSFQVGIDMINAGLKGIPSDPSLYLSRGLLYAQLAQYDEAETDFNRVEKLDSAQSLSSYAVDLADLQRNNPDQALLKVRSQLKAHPDSPQLQFLLAELLMNQTPPADSAIFKDAMRSALTAIKLRPDMVGARDLLASMYMHSGQYSLAIEQCRLVLQQSPADETAAYHLLIALRHSGQSGSAEMKTLVKRLSEMHQQSLKQETDRKRYRLVEQEPPPAQ
jgi:tetratricopeptide (TPR) repeat protein